MIATTRSTFRRAVAAAPRRGRGWAPLLAAVAILAFAAAPTLATSPTIVRVFVHRDRPFIPCPSGAQLLGSWDVSRETTTYYDASGTPVRDHVFIHFTGTISNPATGASVPDSGLLDYRDELAPDGSFLSTLYTFQRTNPYLHEAGSQLYGPQDANGDQALLRDSGMSLFDSGLPAMCAALGL